MKYHINAKGEANLCTAMKGLCPFGEENHYDSLEEARKGYEATMESEFPFMGLARSKEDLDQRNHYGIPDHWSSVQVNDSYLYNMNKQTKTPNGSPLRVRVIPPTSQEYKGKEFFLETSARYQIGGPFKTLNELDSFLDTYNPSGVTPDMWDGTRNKKRK